jgi:hypothetical protein
MSSMKFKGQYPLVIYKVRSSRNYSSKRVRFFVRKPIAKEISK